jgi:formamidopyrimidine-DNA glycosylase
MPELAEVEYFRKQWNPGIGRKILAVKLHARKRIFRGTDTAALVRHLTGARLVRSFARGKQMLFEFSGDNPEIIGARENVRSWLGLHLGMTGKMRIDRPRVRPEKHDHLVLEQAGQSLVFRDSRQFGRVRFQHGKTHPEWWRADIPEIIARGFDQNFLDEFLRRHGKAPIKAVLLMQNGFPGIGNWMADEILWRAKIHPATRAAKVKTDDRAAVLKETKFVARESLRTLAKDFSDPPKSWLIHQRWKTGGVCPKHKIELRRAIIGGRTTAWCPRCQEPEGRASARPGHAKHVPPGHARI